MKPHGSTPQVPPCPPHRGLGKIFAKTGPANNPEKIPGNLYI
jgi:hypothetical protein